MLTPRIIFYEKIIETIKANFDKPVHLLSGGTHLLPAPKEEIKRIAESLRAHLNVDWIAPAHCTGEPAFAILKEQFRDHYLYAGLGSTVNLDINSGKINIEPLLSDPPISTYLTKPTQAKHQHSH